MTPDALHKRAERQRRREAGEKRIEVWLDDEGQRDLAYLQEQTAGNASYAIHCALWSLANYYREDNKK